MSDLLINTHRRFLDNTVKSADKVSDGKVNHTPNAEQRVKWNGVERRRVKDRRSPKKNKPLFDMRQGGDRRKSGAFDFIV